MFGGARTDSSMRVDVTSAPFFLLFSFSSVSFKALVHADRAGGVARAECDVGTARPDPPCVPARQSRRHNNKAEVLVLVSFCVARFRVGPRPKHCLLLVSPFSYQHSLGQSAGVGCHVLALPFFS